MKKTAREIIKYIISSLLGTFVILISTIIAVGYLKTHPDEEITPAGHKRNISKYLTMRDGVKIAVDIWFPATMKSGNRYPTVIKMTRYWRAKERTVLQRGLIALNVGLGSETDILDQRTQWFNESGYVVIHVDARGTGASFGSRKIEWAPEEINDYAEILEWIGRQTWSNGNVGSYGISYAGNTAEMIMTTGRPELKIVAPLYNDFNPFLGLIQPGGAQNLFLDYWGRATHYMDKNDVCGLAEIKGFLCWLTKRLTPGVKLVDGHEKLLELAVRDHEKNIQMASTGTALAYLDDHYGNSGFSTKDIAPFGSKKQIETAGVPMILHLGWTDAATVEGALNRYITFSNDQHLLIGPFSHGGVFDTDPFMDVDRPVSPSWSEQYQSLITYFDMFLKGQARNLKPGKQITYYTLGANEWSTTVTWPPEGFKDKYLYFAADNQLTESIDRILPSSDLYKVDFTASSGLTTRWHTNFGGGDVIYADRLEQDKKLLSYTTAPLEKTVEITGTGIVTLYVSSSIENNMFIAYLGDIAPDGRVTYITEGIIRADNRKIANPDILPNKVVGVAHSYLRKDAIPMVPGETTEISFNLQPISVQIKAGHKLRLSIAGADKTIFKRWPKEGVPHWTIHKGGDAASHIKLPYKIIDT